MPAKKSRVIRNVFKTTLIGVALLLAVPLGLAIWNGFILTNFETPYDETVLPVRAGELRIQAFAEHGIMAGSIVVYSFRKTSSDDWERILYSRADDPLPITILAPQGGFIEGPGNNISVYFEQILAISHDGGVSWWVTSVSGKGVDFDGLYYSVKSVFVEGPGRVAVSLEVAGPRLVRFRSLDYGDTWIPIDDAERLPSATSN